jgi:glycosyltransferase involved in cell wall biosynthesis
MKIALINVPLRDPDNPQQWIPVPPKGYGGIQWVVAHLLQGYLELGHQVWLLGAPTSTFTHRNLTVVQVAEPQEIATWLKTHATAIDLIHDHSDDVFEGEKLALPCPVVRTHHLTGKPKGRGFPVYLSKAQRDQANDTSALVIRLPVDFRHYTYSSAKEAYLLYLGRFSAWKGVDRAAAFAHAVGLKLIIAGPAWEPGYKDEVMSSFPESIEYVGEVGGKRRRELLSKAKALLVFSRSVAGPWGAPWCEPGATVVSEAAASGTPVVASSNGCLREIVPKVGVVIEEEALLSRDVCQRALAELPRPEEVFKTAVREWHYLEIVAQYVTCFRQVSGRSEVSPEVTPPGPVSKKRLLLEGGVVVPTVLDGETLQKLDTLTLKMIREWEVGKDPDYWAYRDEKEKRDILYRIHRLETKDPEIGRLIEHPAVQKLRESIFGKATKATACALIYKDPKGSAPVPWHRDPIDVPPGVVYNFSIYLDRSEQGNGALQIVPGSHLHKEVPATDHTTLLEANPGDISVHDVHVYHGSLGSQNGRMRRSIIIEFQPMEGP